MEECFNQSLQRHTSRLNIQNCETDRIFSLSLTLFSVHYAGIS